MNAEFVTTSDGGLLRSVRAALSDAERAIICVAFVREGGVRLISKELEALRKRQRQVRLLVTTAFESTTAEALSEATRLGVDVGVLNHTGGTYHPKVYLGLSGDRCRAVIGSANLTGGLAANIEAGTYLEGRADDQVLAGAWAWADMLWEGPRRQWPVTEYVDRIRRRVVPEREQFEPELFAALKREVARDPRFWTLGQGANNDVIELDEERALVHTARTRAEGRPAQPVDAAMLNLAWNFLRTHGELTNRHLLNELRVHRSSAVCAMLARLPQVEVVPGKTITLRWRGEAPVSRPSRRGRRTH